MCGIVGLVDASGKIQESSHSERLSYDIRQMLSKIEHRGRDGEGIYQDSTGVCFLGHRRLSIIDTSSASAQPMSITDGRYVITFNGEIYNYRELTGELKAQGIELTSTGDTEVLLQGYRLWGKDVLKKLRGMFAFAIWDRQEKKLFMARDHVGIKPIYWFYSKNLGEELFGFASELKALLALPYSQKKISKQALTHYLQYHFVRPPLTMIEDIFALEPGCYLELQGTELTIQKYWDLFSCKTYEQGTYKGIVARVKEALQESVALHLRADIPVGAFLSGGLDSSALVALASQQTDIPLNTFSVGFGREGAYLDETELAEIVAKKYGCKHQKLIIQGNFLKNNFPAFIAAIDQPSADGLNSYLVSMAAGSEVRVALSGLGGDELFLGYRYFKDLAKMQDWQESSFKRMFLPAFSYGYQQSAVMRSLAYKNNMNFLKFWPARQDDLYLKGRTLFSQEELARLVPRSLRSEMQYDDLSELFSTETDFLNGFSKAELAWYTPGVLLRDADATGMASTLEVRFPFLDVELIELMLSIPGSYKVQPNQNVNKPLLVAALEDILPRELFTMPKRGFEMPVGFWLVNNFTRELRALNATPWLSTELTNRLLEQFYKDPRSYLKVWSLLVLKHWINHHQLEMPYA